MREIWNLCQSPFLIASLRCHSAAYRFLGQRRIPTLQLIVSNETIPAGATGQVKVWAASPMPVASGGFYAYFDPKVFTGIAGVGAFSANGDVTAQATIAGPALGVAFSSILKGSRHLLRYQASGVCRTCRSSRLM